MMNQDMKYCRLLNDPLKLKCVDLGWDEHDENEVDSN